MSRNSFFIIGLILAVFLILPANLHAQKKKKSKNTPQEIKYDETLYKGLEYRLIGPFRGGRSAAVTGVPGEENLFYFGSTGGGIWKTVDGGRSWDNISDGFFGGSIGAISVGETDKNVIYVGGGEKTVRGNVSSGYGVWKSEDAGKTWISSGLEKSRHISRIAIHPDDYLTVYAAVMGNLYKSSPDRGVYKTVDGGKTWKKILFSNDHSGAVDFKLDPNNPRIMYASTWRIQRTPYSLSSGGDGSALWKSSDSGETWKEIPYFNYQVNDMYFADSLHGWAIGNDTSGLGMILETLNGGDSWAPQVEGLSNPLTALYFKDGYGWAVGDNGLVLRTEDGASWIDQNSGKTYPNKFSLGQNYPNPFNPSTKIKFALPKAEKVKIELYNTLGQNVRTLLNQRLKAGYHEVEFNAANLSSGIYFYRIEAGEFQDVKKMVLLK